MKIYLLLILMTFGYTQALPKYAGEKVNAILIIVPDLIDKEEMKTRRNTILKNLLQSEKLFDKLDYMVSETRVLIKFEEEKTRELCYDIIFKEQIIGIQVGEFNCFKHHFKGLFKSEKK